jgi:hypothetical protein
MNLEAHLKHINRVGLDTNNYLCNKALPIAKRIIAMNHAIPTRLTVLVTFLRVKPPEHAEITANRKVDSPNTSPIRINILPTIIQR